MRLFANWNIVNVIFLGNTKLVYYQRDNSADNEGNYIILNTNLGLESGKS